MTERVAVAMSGGVDSSLAAALLAEEGYEVIGLMLRLWSEPAKSGQAENRCCSTEAVYQAQGVAEQVGIPFYVINAEQPFRRQVVDYFIAEYAAGRTPNPCLACNRYIRYGFLLEHALKLGARRLATGHYARVQESGGRYTLSRGADAAKDQSYVLHVLRQSELRHALFPVGRYTKPEVRALAEQRGLRSAQRAESQDLCFIADGDYRRFLSDWAPDSVQPGPIYDHTGRHLGTHRGLPFYTIGQRGGLGIAAGYPLYVLGLDAERNALLVGPLDRLEMGWLRVAEVNWIAGDAPPAPIAAGVQIRYHTRAAPAVVEPAPGGGATVYFREPVRGITPGQAAVFYDGDLCLGGGLIVDSGRDSPATA